MRSWDEALEAAACLAAVAEHDRLTSVGLGPQLPQCVRVVCMCVCVCVYLLGCWLFVCVFVCCLLFVVFAPS